MTVDDLILTAAADAMDRIEQAAAMSVADWDTNQQRDDVARRLVERGVRVEGA